MDNTMKDTRFALLEVDDAPDAPAQPVLAPVAAPAPVRGQTVDKEGAMRALLDEEAAKAAGFTPAPPIYTIGTMVVDAGVENFKLSRQDFERLPRVTEACGQLIERVTAEKRRDVTVTVPTLRYQTDGTLATPTAVFPMSERAFEGLVSATTPGGAGYLRNCGTVGEDEAAGMALRTQNLNYWLPRAIRVDKRKTKKAVRQWQAQNYERLAKNMAPAPRPKAFTVTAEQELKLRIRQCLNGSGEEIFSVVGPRYSPFDVDAIAKVVQETTAELGGRCQVAYNGYKAQFDIMFHSNVAPEKAVAGEFFKAGIRITTADDGTGSIKVQTLIWRNLCLNFMIIDVAKQLTARRRHIGSQIGEGIHKGIEDAKRRVDYFVKKWDESTLENVLERYGIDDADTVFNRLVMNDVVHVPGYSNAELVERLVAAYRTEPGHGKTAFVNAISKAAHMHGWNTMDNVSTLEEKAGELLFAKVWDLSPPVTDEATLLG